MQKYFYAHSKPLSIVTIERVKDSPRTSQLGEASTSPKRTITKLVALCARGGYKASFEACLVDLGGLEKHNFQQRCWKTAESVTVWGGSL